MANLEFEEYLNFLLDVGIRYNMYRIIPPLIFASSIGGDMSSIIKDLDKLLEKPLKKFTKEDWMGTWYVLMLTKGGKLKR